MNHFVDRKRAASGERDEEAGVPLASPQSLVEALRGSRTKQRSSEQDKAPVEPLVSSAEKTPYHAQVRRVHEKILQKHPASWMAGMSSHLRDDREIVAEYGSSDQTTQAALSVFTVDGAKLSKDPVINPVYSHVLEKLHPMLYTTVARRHEIGITAIVMEVGFYSQPLGGGPRVYIGKTKLYFPKPHDNMIYAVDLTEIR